MHAKWESLPFPFHFLPSVQPDGKAPALQSSSYTHHIWWASCCCRVSRRPRVYQMTLVTKENFYLASWFLDEVHGGSSARARVCACVSVDPVACAGVCVESRSASSVFLFLYTMLHFIITFVHWTTPVQKDLRSHHKYHTRWGVGGGGVSSADGQTLSKTKITCCTFATETGLGVLIFYVVVAVGCPFALITL